MAAKTRITLVPSSNIPLDNLVPSNANVRKIKAGVSIEELAEDIARRSLLQSLSVRPVLGADGAETGTYEVQGGGRRLQALRLLAKQKRLARNAPVPCIVKTAGIAEDDSLAENTSREALHPLDQFRAFAALRAKGLTEEDIAAAHMVTPAVVKQRLKLASASPKLLDAYAEDALNLEQLMAFCVTDDRVRQEKVFEAIERRQANPNPYGIRRMLTENSVAADDPRAVFVGLDAYRAAGGEIEGELFDDNGGWLQDPALLMRLVTEKLETARQAILAQGWKWAEATLQSAYGWKQGLDRLLPVGDTLSDDEHARHEALTREYDTLADSLSEDDIDDDVRARLDAIEAQLAELDSRPPKFAPDDMARAGVLLSIGHDGKLSVEYGFVRPEDLPAANDDASTDAAGDGLDGRDDDAHSPLAAGADEDGDDPAGKPLPDRLVQDLTAFRTVALRDALARDFDTALVAATHAMCLRLFYRHAPHSCLQIEAKSHFPATAAGLGDTAAAKAIEKRHEAWAARLPREPHDLWDALLGLNRDGDLTGLFAHCASLTVNAVREPHQTRHDTIRHADRLAAALGLDMTQAGWVPTAGNYLGRVTKARIIEAVREARGEDAARLIEHLKKSDMAKEAERLLQGTDWLPEPLRTPGVGASSPTPDGEDPATAPALPAFLTDGVDRSGEAAHAAQ